MAPTWHGREVKIYNESISNLLEKIPEFGRYPFSIEEGIENEYLDLIARKPHLQDKGYVPVAVVSKEYGFVEHHEVIESVLSALKKFVDNPQSLKAELKLSKYGARMWINFLLPNYRFNPGDGYPIVLQVNCLNSMDKSIAVRLHLSWYREESDTEMLGRNKKWPHPKSFKTEEIEKFLVYQFRRFSKEESLYKKWYETKLGWNSVVKWFNKTVAKKWGAHAAVRAYHIAKTGYDIEIERISRSTHDKDGVKIEEVKLGSEPLELEKSDFISNQIVRHDRARFLKVKMIHEVPGLFTPVENVYHVSQVLSWIASQQETIQGQLERMGQIHGLMDALLKQEKLPITLRLGREYKKSK